MEFVKKHWIKLVSLLLILLFLFSRLFNLNSTMFFINDMGRDMLVIRDWLDSGKPPLLGPQTSALPINQTALYFYMMLPGYLLTNGSPLALFYTFCVMWVAVFIYGLWLLKGNTKMTVAWMIFFFLTIGTKKTKLKYE